MARTKRVNVRRQNGAARARIKARLIAEACGVPDCHLCGLPIDVKLPAGHPWSFEIDELIPVSKGGDPHDARNCAPSHRLCNQRRGNRSMSELSARSPAARQQNMPVKSSRRW